MLFSRTCERDRRHYVVWRVHFYAQRAFRSRNEITADEIKQRCFRNSHQRRQVSGAGTFESEGPRMRVQL